MPESTKLTREQAQRTSTLVEQAIDTVKQAATTAPNTAIEDTLKGIVDGLQGVKDELERINIEAAEQTTAEVTEPVTQSFRFIRRHGRKVKRST